MVYVPQELDHHFATQITDEVDKELKKGNVVSLSLIFPVRPLWTVPGLACLWEDTAFCITAGAECQRSM